MQLTPDTEREDRLKVIKAELHKKCPRCGSKKINYRLDGSRCCRRCTQKWELTGCLIPSGDRRKILKLGPLSQKTHGLSRSPTFLSWAHMKQRCLNKNNDRYNSYGGRGIEICKRWLVFENFLADMGERPKGTSLDRINNNGNYEPTNCRWATPQEQYQNTRVVTVITHLGQTKTLSEWAKFLGIKKGTLACRIHRGWSLDRVLKEKCHGKIA